MNEIKSIIKHNRSHLSDSSVNTYASNLKNLFYKIFDEIPINISLFNDTKEIMKYLENHNPKNRKTILASLFVLTKNPIYQTQMKKDIDYYNNEVNTQIKDHKHKKNFSSWR